MAKGIGSSVGGQNRGESLASMPGPIDTRPCTLLIDGSALFLASRLVNDRPLNYRALEAVLLAEACSRLGRGPKAESAFNPTCFFTSTDSSNEGQQKFLAFIRDRMNWLVIPTPLSDAIVTPSSVTTIIANQAVPYIRFDVPIAYCLARLATTPHNIFVVSDSFHLHSAIWETGRRGSKMFLAFFGQAIDPRWFRYLNMPLPGQHEPAITWIDLDRRGDNLFSPDSERLHKLSVEQIPPSALPPMP